MQERMVRGFASPELGSSLGDCQEASQSTFGLFEARARRVAVFTKEQSTGKSKVPR